MNNQEERNRFFLDNYRLFLKMSNRCAKMVGEKFPTVPYADLLAYAFEGIIVALDKVDLENERWIKFVNKHAIGRTMSGALVMSGTQRHRVKGVDSYTSNIIKSQSDELNDIVESEQMKEGQLANSLFEKYISKDEREWFMNEIDGSVEHAVLLRLFLGESLVQIANNHHLGLKTIRRTADQLKLIYREASENKTIRHLITPIGKSQKYLSLTVTDELREKFEKECHLMCYGTEAPLNTRNSESNQESIEDDFEDDLEDELSDITDLDED